MTSRQPPDLGAIRFLDPRDAGGVLNATFAFLRATARPLAVGYLAIVGPVALAGGLATVLFFRSAAGVLTLDPATASPEDLAAVFGPTYWGTILFSLLTLATTLAFGAALVRRYRDGATAEDGGLSVGAVWDEARPLILPALGMMLAFGSLVLLSALLNALPCLGTLAWLAGLVWVLPYAHVAFAVRMTEGGTLGESVARARSLVAGQWGFAAGALVLAWLVAVVAMTALSIPFYAVAMVVGFNAAVDPAALMETMGVAVGPLQVLTTAAYLVPVLAAFFVHGSLVERHDGGGLWADLDRMDGTDPDPTRPPATEDPAGDAPLAPPSGTPGFRGGFDRPA